MAYEEPQNDAISLYNDLRDSLIKRQRLAQERLWTNSSTTPFRVL